MKCTNCEHLNDGGNFCENCGTRLVRVDSPVKAAAAHPAPAVAQSVPPPQPNVHVENVKQASSMYFHYFMKVLKKPVSETTNVRADQLVNGLISIGLFSVIIPLIIYLSLDYKPDGAFFSVLVKPAFFYALFMILIASYSYVAIKLGRVEAKYADVLARFGSMLIPFVGIFVLAFVFSLLDMFLYPILLGVGFMGAVFIIPVLVISSFKKDQPSGLDTLYGTLLTYIAIFLTFIAMAAMIISTLISMVEDKIDSFFSPFG
ncbi:zinc ribbon domain-containing protein [Rossellomorea aquimaris]|uniref:zinc ribbon domain-containing protein n=1 Tax=Rossellomorea aquimaris TaxID=189382 RepID=UPI001CD6F8B1|nr:zinc ribbon domain-containing protein [Rossellomorea aquimaris]MCA1055270.1 zinc ribbon domain-containing protein [Rossellomorea aquimaris]